MWWSERPLARRALLGAALVLVAGCGFRPLLGEGSFGDELRGRIAVGDVVREAVPDRMTYEYREQLRNTLGRVEGRAPLRVDTVLEVSQQGLAIAQDNSTTRYNLTGTARFVVTSAAGEPVFTGTVTSYTGYSATSTAYATDMAEQDALRRLAVTLADSVAVRLAARADELQDAAEAALAARAADDSRSGS